jgi:hypothetical protein
MTALAAPGGGQSKVFNLHIIVVLMNHSALEEL